MSPESTIALDSGRDSECGLDRSFIAVVAQVEFLLLQHEIFFRDGRDGSRVERLREGNGDVDMAVLRPDRRDILRNLAIDLAGVYEFRPQFERRNTFNVSRDFDRLASLGVVDGNCLLVLLRGIVHGSIKAEIDSATEKQLVEAEALYGKPS